MEALISIFIIAVISVIVSASKRPAGAGQKPNMRTAMDTAKKIMTPPQRTVPIPPPLPADETYDDDLDRSDIMPDSLAQGDSRACDHGSVGGSMDITTHEGQGEAFEHARQKVKTQVKTQVKVTLHEHDGQAARTTGEKDAAQKPKASAPTGQALIKGRMTPEQMRQAVVMAEILKRPAERVRGRNAAAR